MERNVEINATKRRSEVRKTCLKNDLKTSFGSSARIILCFKIQLTINQLVKEKKRPEKRSVGNTRGTNVVQKWTDF